MVQTQHRRRRPIWYEVRGQGPHYEGYDGRRQVVAKHDTLSWKHKNHDHKERNAYMHEKRSDSLSALTLRKKNHVYRTERMYARNHVYRTVPFYARGTFWLPLCSDCDPLFFAKRTGIWTRGSWQAARIRESWKLLATLAPDSTQRRLS